MIDGLVLFIMARMVSNYNSDNMSDLGKSNLVRMDRFTGTVVLSLMFIVVILIVIKNIRNDFLLKRSREMNAIITHISHGAVRSPKRGEFEYVVNGKKHNFNEPGDYDAFSIGDTVLIEYAVEDHSVARVVDKFYMEKNKHLQEEIIIR